MVRTMRVTYKTLRDKAQSLNHATKQPLVHWKDGYASIGHYHISRGDGGYELHQVINIRGGVSNRLRREPVPAKDLASMIDAFLLGHHTGRNNG